jgi:hypothetical protein
MFGIVEARPNGRTLVNIGALEKTVDRRIFRRRNLFPNVSRGQNPVESVIEFCGFRERFLG